MDRLHHTGNARSILVDTQSCDRLVNSRCIVAYGLEQAQDTGTVFGFTNQDRRD